MRTKLLAVAAASAMTMTGLVAVAAPAQAATPPAPFTSVGTTSYTVPAGIRVLKIVTDGAGGGGVLNSSGGYTASGGNGARVTTYVSVVQGDVLSIGVGGGGAAGNGGAGGGSSSYVTGTTGPNDTSLLIVAGGGGGAARNGGGAGGQPNGANGANGRQEGGENNGGRGGSNGNGGAPGPDGTQGTAGLAWASNGTGGTGGTGATGGGKATNGGSGSNATIFTGGGGGGYGGGGGGSATSEAPFGGAGGGGGSTSSASASGYTTTYSSAGNYGWAGSASDFTCTSFRPTDCPPVDDRSQPYLPNNSYWYWGLPGGDGKVTITFEVEDITNTSPPVIGTAPVFTGIPLTITTPSVWSVVNPTIVRQWQYYDDVEGEWIDIVDASEETYAPTGITVGKMLRLEETVMNGDDPVTVYSNELGPVDGWITPPEIAGETMVGETLTVTNQGTYDLPDGTVVPSGNWQRYTGGVWTDIAGETALTYVTTDDDVGFNLRYNESTTASSVAVSQGSNQIGPITGATNLTPPTVSPNEHQMFNIELTATPGTWGPASGIWAPTVTGNWQEFTGGSWVDIAGETGLTFTPDSTYVGKKVRYQETGTANSETTLAESNEVTITGPAPTTDPSISGTRAVGETLTATPGDYSAIDQEATFSLTAIWQVFDGTSWVDITGETGTTLLLKEPQIGKLVRYLETASLEGIEQETPSNEIGPIGGPELISAPVIEQEGPDLTVTDPGVWGVSEEVPDVSVSVTGKWQVKDGSTWVDLGVTSTNLPITASLDGKTVRWLGTGSLGDVDVDSASNEIGPLVVPIATIAPVVDGSTDVGGTVTATPGTWGPGEGAGGPPVVTGQWQVLKNGEWVDIAGQTELTLVTTTDVVGKYVRYVETGTIDGVSTTSESNQFGPIVGKDAPPVIKLNVSGSPTASKFKIGWKKPRGTENPVKYRVTLKQKGFKRIIIRKAVTPPKTSVTVTRKALLKASVLPRGDMALVRYRVFVEAVYPASTSRLKGTGFWVRL